MGAGMENKNEYFIPINEVAKEIDVPAHTLRYWEKQFPGAIRPVNGAGNRRYYRRDTVEKLRSIKSLLYDKGMTIAGVKKILHNGSFDEEVADLNNVSSRSVSPKIVPQKPEFDDFEKNDIEIAIKLLNQAKMFLD